MRISDWSSDVCSSDLLSGGDSLVNQSGASNSANVTQADDGSGATPQNVSDIEQTGDSNSATVNQDTSTFAVQSTSYIEQSGDSNTADVTQVDDWQSSSVVQRSEEHTSELQSIMRISYAVFCLKKKTNT